MVEIDFGQVLKNLDGDEIEFEGAPYTLRRVCVNSLICVLDGDKTLSSEEKFKFGLLARKIHGATLLELSIDEAAMVKKRVGLMAAPLVLTQAFEMLENKNVE
jgi:hypothetical protein